MGTGKQIRELLDEQNKTVLWLSQQTGISSNTLYAMIKRDSNRIRNEYLLEICKALQVSLDKLVPVTFDAFKRQKEINDAYFKKVCEMNFVKAEFNPEPNNQKTNTDFLSLSIGDKTYHLSEGQYFKLVSDMYSASYEELNDFLKGIPEEKQDGKPEE